MDHLVVVSFSISEEMRSVFIIGGYSSSIGPFLIDRLLSQNYGVCVVERKHHGKFSTQALGSHKANKRYIRFAEYDAGIPGDYDYQFRSVIRNTLNKQDWIGIIDLLECSMKPIISYETTAFVSIVFKDLDYGEDRILVKIPPLMIAPTQTTSILNPLKNCWTFQPVVFVGDLVKFISDYILRNPITSFLNGKHLFTIACSDMLRNDKGSPDCLVQLIPNSAWSESVDIEALTEPSKRIYGFYPMNTEDALLAVKKHHQQIVPYLTSFKGL